MQPDAYVVNGHVCDADATAMLLSSVGERVAPGRIEALTGMGLGAAWQASSDLSFFDSSKPDLGITRALGLLGIVADKGATDDGGPPSRIRSATG